MGFKITGAKEMARRFRKLASGLPDEIGTAQRQETEVEATEAKKRTPVWNDALSGKPHGHLPGALRGSVHAEGPFREGTKVWTTIVAGGPSAEYAAAVHEDLYATHAVGQAKFIESVILESRPYLAARIARRISLNRII